MPSVISGYNYDIFISYRQKDNKHDGWVTDFVENLKGELESTFKEEISVYFDVNPHDGILETHDVDESLKDKLKCLVFIPIISRTYCDTGAFAWEHEFKAFVELASGDQFGQKVRLPNGNVASRVLPVQIHDLDDEDIAECESVLGGALRGIEFIYKEAGIDKPLTPDDNEKKNLNNTKYRIQVVKVAHAIKEIIASMKKYEQDPGTVSEKADEPAPEIRKDRKTKIIAGSAIAILLIIFGILFIPKLFNTKEPLKKSIAVLPFKSLSDDPEQEYFSDGITEDILNNLSKIADLNVKSRTSTIQYKGSNKSIPEIGDELSVDIILEGTVRKADNKVRIVAQLINVKKDVHIWSETFDREMTDIFSVQSEIAIEIARTLQASLTETEIKNISREASMDITAYDYYLRGRQMEHNWNGEKNDLEKILQLYKQAIELDPEFALGYYGIGRALYYSMRGFGVPTEIWRDSALILAEKAIKTDHSLPEGYILRSAIYREQLGKQEESRNDLQTAFKLAPNNPDVLYTLGTDYLNEGDYKTGASMIIKSIELEYTKKDPDYYIEWGSVYEAIGEYDKAEMLYKQAKKLNPGLTSSTLLGDLYLFRLGNYPEAIKIYEEILSENPMKLGIIDRLGWSNFLTGNLDGAEKYWSKYMDLEHEFTDTSQYVPFRHRLAYIKWLKGEKEEAMSLFHEQLRRDQETQEGIRGYGIWNLRNYYYDMGAVNAFLGNNDKAYALLDSAANYGWFGLWYAERDPLLNGIRREDWFQDIMQKKKADINARNNAFKEVMDESDTRDIPDWFLNKK
jgi:TolB-like protein/Tfp pilus assembly protein PilF